MAHIKINDIEPRNQYVAAPDQKIFPYTFPIFEDRDLYVIVDGVQKVQGTDYTLTGRGEDDGGNIEFIVPMVGDELITIYRDIPVERIFDYQVNGDFQAETVNDDFDRIVAMIQQNESSLGRALLFPIDSQYDEFDNEIPPPEPNGLLGFNEDGDGLEVVTVDDTDHPFIARILQAEASAEADAAAAAESAASSEEDAARAEAAADSINGKYLGELPEDPEGQYGEGTLYWNDTTKTMRLYDNGAWRDAIVTTDNLIGRKQCQTATEGQTTFVVDGGYRIGEVEVWLNGIKQILNEDFQADNGTTIVFNAPVAAGAMVQTNAYSESVQVEYREEVFTANAGQTRFRLAEAFAEGSLLFVYKNGVHLCSDPDWYTENLQDIVLTTPTESNDKIQVVVLDFIAEGGEDEVKVQATEPQAPSEGLLWRDTDTDDFSVYINGAWQRLLTEEQIAAENPSNPTEINGGSF